MISKVDRILAIASELSADDLLSLQHHIEVSVALRGSQVRNVVHPVGSEIRNALDQTNIRNHSGNKYVRRIYSCVDPSQSIEVDVYAVIEAFAVACAGRQHALKKILCTGIRGKGDQAQDLGEAIDALRRAIQLEGVRQPPTSSKLDEV